jgi:hypothetical protein
MNDACTCEYMFTGIFMNLKYFILEIVCSNQIVLSFTLVEFIILIINCLVVTDNLFVSETPGENFCICCI